MTEKMLENNQVVVVGEVVSDFEFSHEVFGEGFYLVDLKVNRLSNSYDKIPLLISDRLMNVKESYIGKYIEAKGQFRSFNKHEKSRNHLVLSLFAREVNVLSELGDRKPNTIFLDGYICKTPIYRTTPLGREIADVLLAVNRAYSKSDYIPCICWGRNARYAGKLPVGSRIKVWGRIQSREYQKRVGENEMVRRTAYEVSVNKLEYCDDGANLNARVAEPGNSD